MQVTDDPPAVPILSSITPRAWMGPGGGHDACNARARSRVYQFTACYDALCISVGDGNESVVQTRWYFREIDQIWSSMRGVCDGSTDGLNRAIYEPLGNDPSAKIKVCGTPRSPLPAKFSGT